MKNGLFSVKYKLSFRNFQNLHIFGLTLPLIPLNNNYNKDIKKITILHTNDVHSHIDPFPNNDPINPNSGGVIARSNLINSIKNDNPNTLILDAGDVFQGTPYFNFFEGENSIKLPKKEEDIAFSNVGEQGTWIKNGLITSRKLTQIYLDRIEKFNSKLECFATVTKDQALA